jgi:hypothetical protein
MTNSQHTKSMTAEPPSVAAARRLMSPAIRYRGRQERQRLAIVEAFAVLSDVAPPYPPAPSAPPIAETTDLDELIDLVLEHLRAAIGEVTEISDLTRVATAAIVLRRGGGVEA